VPILVAFYDTHELRWGYSLLPATTRKKHFSSALNQESSIYYRGELL